MQDLSSKFYEKIKDLKAGNEIVKVNNYITFIIDNKILIFTSFKRDNLSKRENAILSLYEDLKTEYNCEITFNTYGRIEFFELFMEFLTNYPILELKKQIQDLGI